MFNLIRDPNFLEPAFQNTIAFVVSSTNATMSNFRYTFDTYTSDNFNGNYSFRTRVTTYPDQDNNCVFSPHYILVDQLSTSITPYIISFNGASQSLKYYYVNYGESYNPNITFTFSYAASPYMALTFSTTPNLAIGDIIKIDKDDKTINTSYDGTASITTITAGDIYVTDKAIGTTTIGERGVITDLSRSFTNNYSTQSGTYKYTVYNGSRQYEEIGVNFRTKYELNAGTTTRKFLSVFEGEKPIYYKSGEYSTYETLSFILGTASSSNIGNGLGIRIKTFGSTNSVIQSFDISMSSTLPTRCDAAAGTANLSAWSPGGNPLMNDNVDKYQITLYDTVTSATWSETRTYKIKRHCREYDLITLAFVNKLGGIDYWTFNLVSKYQSKIKRDIIEKVLRYNYSIGDRGRKVINQEIQEEWTINTDYLTDNEALFIKELVESHEVYFLDGTNMLPIVITTDTYDFKSSLNNILVQYTISFIKAYNTISNV